jgi:hypothetical protein
MGADGFLTKLLNEQPVRLVEEGERLERFLKQRAPGREKIRLLALDGPTLVRLFEFGGWGFFQHQLLWHPLVESNPQARRTWRLALMESLYLSRAGFLLRWCEYGRHWFFSDDPRRKDCFVHRVAGQQARWRIRDKERKREAARRQTLAARVGSLAANAQSTDTEGVGEDGRAGNKQTRRRKRG